MKPIDLNSSKKYPLIVSLYGAGGRGDNIKKQLIDWTRQLAEQKIREDYPCYVLAPQSKDLWNADTLTLIKEVISQFPSVDMERIYILGNSIDGHGTFIYIQLDPDYFAATAESVGAGRKQTKDFIDAQLIKDIPI